MLCVSFHPPRSPYCLLRPRCYCYDITVRRPKYAVAVAVQNLCSGPYANISVKREEVPNRDSNTGLFVDKAIRPPIPFSRRMGVLSVAIGII